MWIILIISAVFEAVWATALGNSNGFTSLPYVIVFLVAMAISLAGLAYSLKAIPIGTAYAVWTAIGAALTVIWAMATGGEPVSVLKIVFLIGIIGSTVGLKLLHANPTPEPSRE